LSTTVPLVAPAATQPRTSSVTSTRDHPGAHAAAFPRVSVLVAQSLSGAGWFAQRSPGPTGAPRLQTSHALGRQEEDQVW